MSSSSTSILAAEVEALRSLVEALRLRVTGLEDRLRRVEGEEDELRSEVAGVSSIGGYTFVSRDPPVASTPAPAEPAPASGGSEGGEITVGDTEGRASLARQIGAFLRRCRDGLPRGGSGRDQLKLQSRYYIILADYSGEFLPEPLVVNNFAEVRSRCKRGPHLGQSVFVGVPTQWEARLALESGGFVVPRSLQHA